MDRLKFIASLLFLASPVLADGRADGTGAVTGTFEGAKLAAIWLEGSGLPAITIPKEHAMISQRGARFRPEILLIPIGQTVDMPNDDRITHNVFSMSEPKKFDLGHYSQGQSRSVKFDRAGVVDLFCNIHENMHAAIIVAPSSVFALASDGKFTFEHVPPGTYKVQGYALEAGPASGKVTVTPGRSVGVALQFKK